MRQQAARGKGTRDGSPATFAGTSASSDFLLEKHRTRRFFPLTTERNVRIIQERDLAFPRIDHSNCMQVLAWTERQFRKAIDEAGS